MTISLLSPLFTKFSVESTVIQTKENKTKDVFFAQPLYYAKKMSRLFINEVRPLCYPDEMHVPKTPNCTFVKDIRQDPALCK